MSALTLRIEREQIYIYIDRYVQIFGWDTSIDTGTATITVFDPSPVMLHHDAVTLFPPLGLVDNQFVEEVLVPMALFGSASPDRRCIDILFRNYDQACGKEHGHMLLTTNHTYISGDRCTKAVKRAGRHAERLLVVKIG